MRDAVDSVLNIIALVVFAGYVSMLISVWLNGRR